MAARFSTTVSSSTKSSSRGFLSGTLENVVVVVGTGTVVVISEILCCRFYTQHNISFITGFIPSCRVRNLKFATYLKFATCGNTNKINELR